MAKPKSSLRSYLWLFLLLVFLFFLWEILAYYKQIDPLFFSSPSRIWTAFLSMLSSGVLWRHLSITLKEAGLGLLYGGSLGCLVGLGLGMHAKLSALLMPLMVGLNSVPKLALAPLFILWFGIGLSSKVLISALMVFFIFVFNVYAGYHSVDPELKSRVRMLGGSSLQLLRHVIWPFCLPWFLASLRTGVGLALSGAIVGEFIGASRGLGWLIHDASGRYDLSRVLCCIFVMIAIVMLLDGGIRMLERRFLRWRPR